MGGLKVYVPYTKITPGAQRALERFAPMAERVYVGQDDQAYWRFWRDAWALKRTFMVVEHDVVIGEDTVAEMTGCPKSWCAAPYPYISTISHGLACVKFRSELMVRFPTLFEMIGAASIMRHPQAHWCTLDMAVSPVLWALGNPRCENHNMVDHPGHEFRSTHGCSLAPAAG
jgi:hypothetical protein